MRDIKCGSSLCSWGSSGWCWTQGSPFKGRSSLVIQCYTMLRYVTICYNPRISFQRQPFTSRRHPRGQLPKCLCLWHMLQCHNVTMPQCHNVAYCICYIPTNIREGNRFWHISCMLQYVTLCHTYMLQCSICALSLELLAKEKGASIPWILRQEVLLCRKSNNLMDVGQSHANGLGLNEWRQK